MKDDTIPSLILGIGDIESSLGKESSAEWRERYLSWSKNTVNDYYEKIKARLESQNLITGRDLISLGMEPGPEMGRCLDILRNAQDTEEIITREDALILAKKLLAKKNTDSYV